jgi:hypothetical protein
MEAVFATRATTADSTRSAICTAESSDGITSPQHGFGFMMDDYFSLLLVGRLKCYIIVTRPGSSTAFVHYLCIHIYVLFISTVIICVLLALYYPIITRLSQPLSVLPTLLHNTTTLYCHVAIRTPMQIAEGRIDSHPPRSEPASPNPTSTHWVPHHGYDKSHVPIVGKSPIHPKNDCTVPK